MAKFLYSILRDLYVVLLLMLAIEVCLGREDLLHDVTRKGVMIVTCFIAVAKLLQQPLTVNTKKGPIPRGPQRLKKTEGDSRAPLAWASSEMQGWRPAMEDATCVLTSLPEPLCGQAFFGVFDGHGGSQVSMLASQQFPQVLTNCAMRLLGSSNARKESGDEVIFEENGNTDRRDSVGGRTSLQKLCVNALQEATLTLDQMIRDSGAGMSSAKAASSGPLRFMASQLENVESRNAFNLVGSTAIVALVDYAGSGGSGSTATCAAIDAGLTQRARFITVANCGDSRAVLCRAGRAVELSEDHKPELPQEEARIRNAGGHVAQSGPCYRVDGWGLNLSRALGDFHYKARHDLPPEQQKVSAVAEVRTLELTGEDEFLVLGCDGIFELHTSQEVVDIVRKALRLGLSVEKTVEELLDRSCSSNLAKTRGKGGDNCSAILVVLQREGNQ